MIFTRPKCFDCKKADKKGDGCSIYPEQIPEAILTGDKCPEFEPKDAPNG